MEQASMRDVLQELAEQPIGGKHLQDEADRIAHAKGAVKASEELKETVKRAAKIWLPQGKKPPRPRGTCNAPDAQQTDLEDAVEAAGGKRGGRPGDAPPLVKTDLVTAAKHGSEFATLFRGQFAMADPGYYSTFKRKRDAQTFADFIVSLFGDERLERMESDVASRPTRDERDAMRAELDRLRGKHAA